MPFLPPNQQHQSTEGAVNGNRKMAMAGENVCVVMVAGI